MDNSRSELQVTVDEVIKRLIADPSTRAQTVATITRCVQGKPNPERSRMEILAWINRDELAPRVQRLVEKGYEYDHISDDSPDAHRTAAELQRILAAFGLELGPDGVDGYFGGPPGKPVLLDLEDSAALIARRSSKEKLLSARTDGATESWTRDATRRLQTFIGLFGLGDDHAELRQDCLVRTDGLFGSRTLAGLHAFLQDSGLLRQTGA